MNYSHFVESRVKWLPTFAEDLHHAATGICGEAIEFYFATDAVNALEELGDIEFYLEHARLTLHKWKKVSTGLYTPPIGQGLFGDLLHIGGDILDMSKKVWIYGEPPSRVTISSALDELERVLDLATTLYGRTRENIQDANRAKLEKRYPTGYSDAAAQARADKS